MLVVGGAFAQQQESQMLNRILNPNREESSRMQDRGFTGGSGVQVREFSAGSFQGTRSVATPEFNTRSFFGLRNPWFGRKVVETDSARFRAASADRLTRQFSTEGFETRQNSSAGRSADMDARLPASASPREAALPAKSQGGVDRFTENLTQDLSIDQVRDLLNKGAQNR